MFNYTCTKIIKYEDDVQIYQIEKVQTGTIQPNLIDCNTDNYLNELEQNYSFGCSRNSIFGLKKYPNIVVKLNYISGFENFPDYSTSCIYSPFSSKEQVEKLLVKVKDMDNNKIKEYIRTNLSEYITPYMMQIVKSHNINKQITEEQIKDEYISLIFDFVNNKKSIKN